MDNTNVPHEAVLQAVAQTSGLDPIELDEPLYEAIDPEALDTLIESSADGVSVTFQYHGCIVTVNGSAGVKVELNPEGRSDHSHTTTAY